MAEATSKSKPVPVCLDTRWRTVWEMSALLDAAQSWTSTHARRSGYQPEWRLDGAGNWRWCYPAACFALLQRERAELMAIPPIGNMITVKDAAKELGSSVAWIRDTMSEHSMLPPRPRRLANNQPAACISRYQLKRLKKLRRIPPRGWHTEDELSEITGWDYTTVHRRLTTPEAAAAGITSDEFRCRGNGRLTLHYSRGAEAFLGHKPTDIPPAGDCLAAARIARFVGRSEDWVHLRLRRPRYQAVGRPMFDDYSRSRIHYPTWVVKELAAESALLRREEEAKLAAFKALPAAERKRIQRRRARQRVNARRLRRRRAALRHRAGESAPAA